MSANKKTTKNRIIKQTVLYLVTLLVALGCAGGDSQITDEQSPPATTQLPEAWARIRSEDDQRRVAFIYTTDNMKIDKPIRMGNDSADALINHFVYRLHHTVKSGLESRGFIIDSAAATQYAVDVESLSLGFKGSTSLANMRAESVIRVDIKHAKYQTLVSKQVSAEALGRPHISYNFKEYSRLISKCSQILVQRAFPKPVLEALADSTDPAGFDEAARTSPPDAAVAIEETDTPDTDGFPTDSGLDFGNYYALVIGNNAYQSLPHLETAINDARVVGQMLRDKYGFRVDVLTDATREDILWALNHFRRTLSANDNLLIYYAGHGWLDMAGDEGYWLPVDAEKDIETNWISNSHMTTTLRAIEAKHVMVVADSCYSGKLTRGVNIKNRTTSYLARIVKKRSRTVLSSGGLEPVLDSGGRENHSVFAAAFIEALTENEDVVDATRIFTKIRRSVMLNSHQMPEYADIRYAGHDGGDFLFVPLQSED